MSTQHGPYVCMCNVSIGIGSMKEFIKEWNVILQVSDLGLCSTLDMSHIYVCTLHTKDLGHKFTTQQVQVRKNLRLTYQKDPYFPYGISKRALKMPSTCATVPSSGKQQLWCVEHSSLQPSNILSIMKVAATKIMTSIMVRVHNL